MPLTSEKLLTVDSSFVLTGLGVLVRTNPETGQPRLLHYPLHTVLAVVLVFADGPPMTATASVEEVTRSSPLAAQAMLTEYALLLQLPEPVAVPAGTEVWLAAEQPADPWL
ncbi:hypothetical protein [Hymenobacter metallicola]|uniref:Uncharacterized protein n=1 Tax=Hymenobacter metallicola TaxID=2563114 RepID=A0A4Z0QBK2_9BACT|nr:hypothetical protein [Hymenobacter metallicola]TGE26441.1 hypothetical protein E5K02_16740 [Hymenobacter metallicola]